MRLVTVTEDADDVRRRVRQSELESLGLDPGDVAEVLTRYGEARLLTFDRDPLTRGPTVEVAHEALLRHWERFRRWLDDRREALLLHRRFRAAHTEWDHSPEDDNYLLTGGRLTQFRDLGSRPRRSPSPPKNPTTSRTASPPATEAETRRRRIRRASSPGSPPPPSSPWSSPPPPSSNATSHRIGPTGHAIGRRSGRGRRRAEAARRRSNRPKWPVPVWPTAENASTSTPS